MADPIVTGVVYRIREVANEDDPLHHTPYFGQTFGHGDPQAVAKRRWSAEVCASMKTKKLIGLEAAIRLRGADAFSFVIIASRVGKRSDIVTWLDAEEVKLIAEAGGPLRDQEVRLQQTLNITSGGHANATVEIVALEAQQKQLWRKFQKRLLQTIAIRKSIENIRDSDVCPDGYAIGKAIARVRQQGVFLYGRPDESARRDWLRSLPGWFDRRSKSDAAKQRYGRMADEEPDLLKRMKEAAAIGRNTASAKAKKKKTTDDPEWKQRTAIALKERNARMKASGAEALRIEKQKSTIRIRREKQLEACGSELERQQLQKKFDRNDKYNALRKKGS